MKRIKAVISAGMIVAAGGTSFAATLIVGNNGGTGACPIETFDFDAGGTKTGSFFPTQTGRGRGIAVGGDEVYYAKWVAIPPDFVIASPAIQVAPFNGGAGGADTRTIPNPAPGNGIAGLTFFQGYLYAMTGYTSPREESAGLQVWKLNPFSGRILAGPINIVDHDGTGHTGQEGLLALYADGFAVLPNGNFLINKWDACTNYEEFSAITGERTGFAFNVPNAQWSTGVDTDGTYLYFAADPEEFAGPGAPHLVKTDMLGNLVDNVPQLNGNHGVEDISLQHVVYKPTQIDTRGITNGTFRLTFTNWPGFTFTVFATTNLATPYTNWNILGSATEVSPGHFEYADGQAENLVRRFYRIGWP